MAATPAAAVSPAYTTSRRAAPAAATTRRSAPGSSGGPSGGSGGGGGYGTSSRGMPTSAGEHGQHRAAPGWSARAGPVGTTSPMTTPPDWAAARELVHLDPAVAMLNTGSFGP